MRAPDGWDSARFLGFSELWQFLVSELFSPQPPVTPAVGRLMVQGDKLVATAEQLIFTGELIVVEGTR